MDVGYISVHSTMEWSNEASLSLLEEYRKNPVLWDSTHSFYYSKNKKQDAWELIAQAMDLNVHEVRQKMNSLLGSFRRERAKERKSLGDTRGHGKIYLSRWFAFEKMKFLLNRKSNKGIKADQSVVLIMGIMGACRRDELYKLKVSDCKDFGSAVLVEVPNTKTKIPKKFTITGHFYDIFKKYANLRPPNQTSFFMNYLKGKCTVQRVGINKFGNLGKQIANYLKLANPELYTGHCFRRSSATVLVDSAGEGLTSLCKGVKSQGTNTEENPTNIASEEQFEESIFEETEERDEDDQDDVLSNCSIVLKSEKEDADESVDPLMTLMELDRTPAPYVPTPDKKKIKRLKMTPTNSNLKSTVEDSRIEELLTNEPCNYDQLDQDECHTFGQHIANKLRKYNKRTRALVEHAINNVIFEADMENYSHLLSFNPSNQSDASNTNSYI